MNERNTALKSKKKNLQKPDINETASNFDDNKT